MQQPAFWQVSGNKDHCWEEKWQKSKVFAPQCVYLVSAAGLVWLFSAPATNGGHWS